MKVRLDKSYFKGEQFYLILIFLLLTFFMGFRALSVGSDTIVYYNVFHRLGQTISYFEVIRNSSAPIYDSFARMIYRTFGNYQIFLFIISVFINLGLLLFIKTVSKSYVMSVFCWLCLAFFALSMNAHRQSLAIVIVLNVLVMLTRSITSIKGWLLVLLAIGIHPTASVAIIGIAGVLLGKAITSNKLLFLIAAVGGLVATFLMPYMILLFIAIFPRFEMYFYATAGYYFWNYIGEGRIIILYIFLLLLCLLWIFGKDIRGKDDFNRMMLPFVTFGAVFGILNSGLTLVNRVVMYITAIHIVFIPSVIDRYDGYMKQLLRFGIGVALLIYFIFSLLDNHGNIIPFRFFWQ